MPKEVQRELVTKEYWTNGVYVRELFIPADTLLTGHIHRNPCLNIVPMGDIEVVTEEGKKRVTVIDEPVIFEAPGGIKRAGYTFSDTIWITVHSIPSDVARDSDAMAALLTSPSFDELELHSADDH